MSCHAPPHHDTSTTKFDSGKDMLLGDGSTSLFPHPNPPIRPHMIDLHLIREDDMKPVILSPVLVLDSKVIACFDMAFVQERLLGLDTSPQILLLEGIMNGLGADVDW